MQRMETDTATGWVVDRIRKDMVDVHQHRRDHQAVGKLPAISEEQADQYRRDNKMQGQVKN
jgi:hypothetical protein